MIFRIAAVIVPAALLLGACALFPRSVITSAAGLAWQHPEKDEAAFERDKLECMAEAHRRSAVFKPNAGEAAAVPAEVWADAYTGQFIGCMERYSWQRLDEPAGAALDVPLGIAEVQRRLRALGYDAGPVDGIMGPRTGAAVRAFQSRNPPLQVDGIPGPNTQALLLYADASR